MRQIKLQERLDKILANHGFGTRSEVKRIVKNGCVTVNDTVVKNSDIHIELSKDRIAVDGEILEIKPHVYFMMNKKAGYVCTAKTGANPTVFELLDEKDRGRRLGGDLGIVGRLDIDTEGLLILTTDGELNHQLTSPKYDIPKTYFVRLEQMTDCLQQAEYTDKIAEGVRIPPEDHEDSALCKGGELTWIDGSTCLLTIYEGLYHEVKRIFSALGNKVVYLKRVRVNGLELDTDLKPGEYRELSEDELIKLCHTLTNRYL
ncbi:MAG: rRNA pseudouridine synthase [Spirochaetia bacterium]|nr:rRNA pseudouridine synthase [Spirochaetia bacterium]